MAKMILFRISWGVLFLGFVSILKNFGNGVKGEHCSSYEPLEHKELEKGNCEQLVNGTHEKYRAAECIIYRYYQGIHLKRCLSFWCNHFASCFNQTTEWATFCTRRFYWFRSSQFDISVTDEGVNASYVRNIHIKYCGKTYPDWKTVRFKFSIKTTGYQCQSETTINAACSGKWIGYEKCDKLINGTHSSWYSISSTNYWCKSFETCLASQKLKERCLADFRFYYTHFWHYYYQGFTFEVSSYLPDTRIQVHYRCSYPYSFGVNIIRCDSVANSNGSQIDIGKDSIDGDDDDNEDYDVNTEMTNAINSLDVQRNDSLQNAVEVFDAVINGYINKTSLSGRSLNKTRQEKMEEILMATVTFEDFALRFGQHHLNRSSPVLNLASENVDLQVRRGFYEDESDFLLQESKGQNYIRIPSKDFHNGSVLLGVVYKDLNELFETNQTESNQANKTSRSLNTVIMSATLYPRTDTLRENVTLLFTNVKKATRNRECVFWNFVESSPVGWLGQGCFVKSMDYSKTECSCNHLTHFAVLMQFDTNTEATTTDTIISETDERILNILTNVGLVLSLIGIILTIICYVFLTDIKTPLSQIRVSLVSSLGAGQIIFMAGIGATENKGACVAVAALTQYFLMAAFCWMLIEGIYLYLFVVKVYNVSNKVKICHGFSWGFPVVMVTLSLSIAAGKNGIKSFVSDKYCWMSASSGLLWIFVSFIVVVEVLNVLILVRVIKEMSSMKQVKDNQVQQIRLGIRACVVLIPLLGVTWLFGLLSSTHKAFVYIFTVFNTTQGFFIFVFHCVRNTEIRERFRRKIRAVLPAAGDGVSTMKKSSKLNDSSGNVSLRKIKVMPMSMNSKSHESLVKAS